MVQEDNIRTIKINVFGRVQGVNFRHSTWNFAKSLRLCGFVRNLSDGSVEIIAQGDERRLEELLRWSQKGSALAHVDGMAYQWMDNDKKYKSFDVRRSDSFIKDQFKSFFQLGKRIKRKIENSFQKPEIKPLPNHVVIIPDGNRRWAKENNLDSFEAYRKVAKRISKFIDFAKDFEIKHLTIWGFSTENWKRDDSETQGLMQLFGEIIENFREDLFKEGVRFRHLGRKDRLPVDLVNKFQKLEKDTKNFKNRSLNVAIDYGGRDEIMRAVEACIQKGKKCLNEKDFEEFLDTKGLPDPDLIIRTSGEKRLSGLMPWQSVYSEFYFTNVYFPDFGYENFREALVDYANRKRRYGGDSKEGKVQVESKISLHSNIQN